MHLTALPVQLLGNRVGNSAAYAAAHHSHLAQTLGMGGAPQRAHEIVDEVALAEVVELFGGSAHHLKNDGDAPFFPVIIRDRQGDAFTLAIRTQNDKLTRLRLFGHQRGFHLHQGDGGVQYLLYKDPIHGSPSLQRPGIAPDRLTVDPLPCGLGISANR